MKRLTLASALAVALLAGTHGQARANGTYGFGFGFGVNLSFSGWTFNPCNPCGPQDSTCCCIIPGWSPVYSPPTMFGGLQALQAQAYGGYGYPGGYPGGPPAETAGGKGAEKSGGKGAEKPDKAGGKTIEK